MRVDGFLDLQGIKLPDAFTPGSSILSNGEKPRWHKRGNFYEDTQGVRVSWFADPQNLPRP